MNLCRWILADGGWWGCEDVDEDEVVFGWLVRAGTVKGELQRKMERERRWIDRHRHRAEEDRRKMDGDGDGDDGDRDNRNGDGDSDERRYNTTHSPGYIAQRETHICSRDELLLLSGLVCSLSCSSSICHPLSPLLSPCDY